MASGSKGEEPEKRDRSEYLQAYYKERRDELSAAKKRRYEEDPEYRQRAKEAAQRARIRRKEERRRKIESGEIVPANRSAPRKPETVIVGGEKLTAYTVTIAARMILRSVDTINYWTRIGVFPETPIRSSRGDRLYTDGMILAVKVAVARRGKVASSDSTFKSEIEEAWRELGVYEAELKNEDENS